MTFAQEQPEERASAPRPSHHAVIMRGVVAPMLGLLAVASIVFGVLNATIWKPDVHVNAAARVSATRYVVTDPGVLRIVDDHARLRVSGAGDHDVCIALGSPKDVAGWVAGQAVSRITGLGSWSALSVERMKAQGPTGQGDADADIKDSDMWSKVSCGSSEATIRADQGQSGDVALVDLGADDARATIAMRAVRQKTPDFAMPFYFVGGLLALLTVLAASVFAMPYHKRRKRMVESEPVESADEVAISEAFTGSIRGLTSAVRKPKGGSRHKRHSDRAAAEAVTNGGSSAKDGVLGIGAPPDGSNGALPASPAVIDPMNRNLVADVQGAQSTTGALSGSSYASGSTDMNGEGGSELQSGSTDGPGSGSSNAASSDADAETTVISANELQAYFARLSQEFAPDDGDDADDAEEASGSAERSDDANTDSPHGDASQSSDEHTDGAGDTSDSKPADAEHDDEADKEGQQ